MTVPDKILLLYDQPTLLTQDAHRALRLAHDASDFSFAAHANSFLLGAAEVPEAALHYPVLFIGQEGGPYSLAMLAGLDDRQNLLVDTQGHWAPGCYIPAFVRRYPFILLEQGPGRFSVGFDAAWKGFGETAGEPLFNADGSRGELLEHAVRFLESYHQEMTRTLEFAGKLAALGLLVPRRVEVSSNAGRVKRMLGGFHAVDEQRLARLAPEQLAQLAAGPELGWIYLHLNSLRLVEALAARVDAAGQRPAPASPVPGPAPAPEAPAPKVAGKRARKKN